MSSFFCCSHFVYCFCKELKPNCRKTMKKFNQIFMGWRIPSLFKSSDFLCNQLRLSNLARVHHIHLAMTTKPLQLIKASFTLYKDYDILFFYFSYQYSAKQKCYFTYKIGPYKIDIFKSCPRILLRNLPFH